MLFNQVIKSKYTIDGKQSICFISRSDYIRTINQSMSCNYMQSVDIQSMYQYLSSQKLLPDSNFCFVDLCLFDRTRYHRYTRIIQNVDCSPGQNHQLETLGNFLYVTWTDNECLTFICFSHILFVIFLKHWGFFKNL